MRHARWILIVVSSLMGSAASAQEPPADIGQVDFGFRGTLFAGDSDEARYQRYRDLRTGPFADGFRFARDRDHSWFDVQAAHVGYRDQRYAAQYNRFGTVKVSAEWNQIPLFFSRDTSTLFTSPSPGVLLLPDALQAGLQNRTTTLQAAAPFATPFDLRLKRSIADVRLTYSATQNLDLTLSFRNTDKTDSQPWAGTFGFSDAVELQGPLDTRTTEFGAAAEWANARGQVRVGYDSSLFRNNVGTLVWDNPLRITDSPTAGPVQGRMALWPNSDLNSGSVSGLVKLPANSQATAYVSLGRWSQDAPLIPFTINTALPVIPLDRPTADASARVTATAFTYNARPFNHLWLNARFRSYDFDNRTPQFRVTNTVAYDTTVSAFPEGGTSPYSFTRKTFDLDASWTPLPHSAFRAAVTHEIVDQTFRTFDTTTENTLRLSADATGISWLTLRGVYEHARRVGSGLDEQSLDDIGEQVSLRQFDLSDRTSDRVSAIVFVVPRPDWSLNGSAFVGREDRPGTVFGLRSNDNAGLTIGAYYVPGAKVSVGGSYTYEHFTALQASRQANPGPQFDDPTRDWTTDSNDRAHTVTASADLVKLWPKTDIRIAYDFSRAESVYVYGLAPNSTLPPVSQLPPVLNSRHRETVDARYFLTPHLAAGLVFWHERYDVDDFAFNPSTLNTIAQPSFLMLGYVYRPYNASTIWARLTYLW